MKALGREFFNRDCLEVAPDLVGKILCARQSDGTVKRVPLTEIEAYRGEEDTACHAHKGRTPRTELLYGQCGIIYVYLCYGMHWLMNIITGDEGLPQGVLLRAGGIPLDDKSFKKKLDGPAKLTKYLGIDKSQNGRPIFDNPDLWIEDTGEKPVIRTDVRVGIDYATEEYRLKQWRYISMQTLPV